MSITDRYLEYAAAFEASYADDDWSHLEPFFTEDAVYTGGAESASGRETLLAYLKNSVDSFDRKMDSRSISLDAPSETADSVRTNLTVTYTKSGCPDLVISGREIAEFDGERIARLTDEFDSTAEQAMGEWMAAHAEKL